MSQERIGCYSCRDKRARVRLRNSAEPAGRCAPASAAKRHSRSVDEDSVCPLRDRVGGARDIRPGKCSTKRGLAIRGDAVPLVRRHARRRRRRSGHRRGRAGEFRRHHEIAARRIHGRLRGAQGPLRRALRRDLHAAQPVDLCAGAVPRRHSRAADAAGVYARGALARRRYAQRRSRRRRARERHPARPRPLGERAGAAGPQQLAEPELGRRDRRRAHAVRGGAAMDARRLCRPGWRRLGLHVAGARRRQLRDVSDDDREIRLPLSEGRLPPRQFPLRHRDRRAVRGNWISVLTPRQFIQREAGRIMADRKSSEIDNGRRNALKVIGTGAAALSLGGEWIADAAAATTGAAPAPAAQRVASGPYNILFILTDQERHFRPGELPKDLRLPAHARLIKRGTVFENHQINSCVCTPSRSVVYTGRHIQQTKMFDNTNFPWTSSLSTDLPTLGDMLRQAGYYTAYKGKWHLTKEFETVTELGTPTKIFTKAMDAYGFSDYFGVGDIIAHDRGGYLHDGLISSMAVNWLRGQGMELAAERKPWFLAVNLVNPHDIMFLDTDRPGEPVQAKNILGRIRPVPKDPLYEKQWSFDLSPTYGDLLDGPGRPAAHADYIRSHDGLVGNIPNEDWRWRARHNYYLNCLRDVDRNMLSLLDELDSLGLASKTIIVMTADHGDLDGAHRLHAKGATAYREQNNVPLIIVHPRYAGGKRCKAVTSHVDLAPTLVGLTNVADDKKAAIEKGLPGRDFSHVLPAPEKASLTAVRDGALYCYNMFAYIDGDFMHKVVSV